MAVLLPAAALGAFALAYSALELALAVLTGHLFTRFLGKPTPIPANPAHFEILGAAVCICVVVTTALYLKAYKFGPGVFASASGWILRFAVFGGLAFALLSGWYEKTAFYTTAASLVVYPGLVADDLAAEIAEHPVAKGQPLSEIVKYLWVGFPSVVAVICGWLGLAIVAGRLLIWLIYLPH
jgi:hypothetical protein